MDLKNEQKIKMVQFDIDLTPNEAEMLASYGLKLISRDKNELINYAVNYILRDLQDKLQKDNTYLEKILKKAHTEQTSVPAPTPTEQPAVEKPKRGRPKKQVS